MKHTLKSDRAIWLIAATLLASFVLVPCTSALAKTSAKTEAAQEADLNLALDQVNLDIQNGKTDQAHALIEKLKVQYPGNPEVAAAEADLYEQQSDARGGGVGLSELCMPSPLDVNSQDLLQRERTMANSRQGGFACGGYNRRITTEAYEQITNLTGQFGFLSPSMNLFVDLENDHLNTRSPFTRANGTEQSFYGNRQQGTVSLRKTFNNGDQGAFSVFGIDNNAGAGAQYVFRDRWGGTSVQANFNQPNWDYVETTVEYGTKDNFFIERRQNFSPDFQAVLRGGVTHYTLDNFWSAADAPGWNFDLDYFHSVNLSDQPPDALTGWSPGEIVLGGHYAVDAEYFTFVNHRTDRTGDVFNPLPATTYEVHTFTVSAAKSILPNVNAQIEGGYGVNRIDGSSGPVYAGSLVYTPIQHLGIDIHASRDLLGGQNSGEKQEIIGTNVKWVW